jgi:acyl-coenzyme A synthetase/AMP-(fatty) acid ligase
MSGARLPLLAHSSPGRIVAWTPAGPVSAQRFLSDVARLAERLPAGGSVLNICQDRYRFIVGFAASLITGKVSLLPPSQTEEAVRQLKAYAADVFCLHDGNGDAIDLPKLVFPELPAGAIDDVPEIDEDRISAVLFTSGSTGAPTAHVKCWGALARSSQHEAERLGACAPGYSIVGTVPVQHSYGFESTIMLTLQSTSAIWSGWPFYPADIAAALAAVPQPRFLVTTPFHLRTLLDSGVDVPAVDRLLSATAPLADTLARDAEARLGAPVYEIYGCTETGQLASRRTTDGPRWLALPGVSLEQEDDLTFALGGNGGNRQLLGDIIELHDDGTFSLHGRNADMVNIAGKRTSIAHLNHQLTAIPGVRDGCFLMPDESATTDGITRLCAFVVAPTLSPKQLRDALRARIDPIFLPRPMLFLDRLPRNATGKLPRGELIALLEGQRSNAQ